MPVTINVNGLSLCHKDSNGIAIATVPDVCKTPSPGGPVPVPYPNIAYSKNLVKGTRSIAVDGGNMAAHQSSEFGRSSGDEAGTAGGIKSSTNMKEATWLTFSFDVKLEGEGACRLTDKMLMNHGNTVCCAGLVQEFRRGPKGPNECAELLARIILIIGEGMTDKTNGIRGLEERMAQQITGAGAPTDPLDGKVNIELNLPQGGNSWIYHDKEIERQQLSLERHLDMYDEFCKGGPPPPPNARNWVGKPRPQPSEWKGTAPVPAPPAPAPVPAPSVPSTGVNWGQVGWAVGLTGLAALAFVCPFDGPAGEILAGSAAARAWERVLGGVLERAL